MDKSRDPYRLDTPAGHRDGAWLAEQMGRLGITGPIHLRGLHYALVASADAIKPNGERYVSADPDWEWLQDDASKAARWLGYVPFEAIVDERNSAPIIAAHDNSTPEPWIGLGSSIEVRIPSVEDIKPVVYLDFEPQQKHRLTLWGEKTSIGAVVQPLCESYRADLYLPSGESTDSQLHLMARAGAEDGRPMIVFVVADFDPSGHQMAVSIGRKLQALRDLEFPDLVFEVIPIALTEEQVRALDLPSSPLKETEKRADRWRLAHGGLEQTEVDALAQLRAEVLRQIVVEGFDQYYDHTLERRALEIRDDWLDEAQAALDAAVDTDLIERLHAEAESRLAEILPEVERINEQLRSAASALDVLCRLCPICPSPSWTGAACLP